eukprot:341615-Chlamydomonas_euryale.AAC.1
MHSPCSTQLVRNEHAMVAPNGGGEQGSPPPFTAVAAAQPRLQRSQLTGRNNSAACSAPPPNSPVRRCNSVRSGATQPLAQPRPNRWRPVQAACRAPEEYTPRGLTRVRIGARPPAS